jgi:hypothetical protein
MTRREQAIAILKGEKLDVIPSYGECPMDVTVGKILPEPTGDRIQDLIAIAEFMDNVTVGTGIGLKTETISRDDTHHTYRYETGAVWHESYVPTFNREATEYPINTPEEALNFTMPDPWEPDRFNDEAEKEFVQTMHEKGFFVQGSVLGAWFGTYYFLSKFETVLSWMACEPEAAHALFDMTSHFSLESAKRVIASGVDAIFTASDLGSGNGLLFSPRMFDDYVFPWLKSLADLCHENGVFLHLHSHGHIENLMDRIVEAGVDMINPIGPSDHNDLAMFKEKWGNKITIMGGIGTTIAQMTDEEMREHVRQVVEIGRQGGRFFPRTESGIPPMPQEKALKYLQYLKEERKRGYA